MKRMSTRISRQRLSAKQHIKFWVLKKLRNHRWEAAAAAAITAVAADSGTRVKNIRRRVVMTRLLIFLFCHGLTLIFGSIYCNKLSP